MVVIYIKVIILAAGIGSRLNPLTLKKPKCMVKVDGISLIEHQLNAYLNASLEENSIYVVVGYKSQIIKQFLNENYSGVNIIENKDYLNTNNMYSLYLALNELKLNNSEPLFINNGDCVYDPAIISEMVTNNQQNLIASDKDSYIQESMKINVEGENIVDISKELPEDSSFGVSIDLYKLSSEATEKLKDIIENYIHTQKELNLWTEVAIKDLLSYETFSPYNIKGKSWVEIDNLDDLAVADIKFSSLDLKNKKCFIMDLDGTVYLGNKPINGTINFINQNMNNKDFYFLTNNTSKIPHDYVENLQKLGIEAVDNKIMTPIYPLLDYLKENKIKKIYFVANSKFIDYIQSSLNNLEITDDPAECEAVLLAYDTELTYEKLKTASLLLQKNKKIIFLATHIDMFCPTENGNIPDIGSMILVIEETSGRKPDMIFGKPNKVMLESMKTRYNDEEVVVVGDRLKTDKKLADNLNYDFVCVLSGETKREDVEMLKENDYPSMVIKNLGELL